MTKILKHYINGEFVQSQSDRTAQIFNPATGEVESLAPMAFHSFGGWKNSLFGDHPIHGPEGVRSYTKLKTITTRWLDGEQNAAVMPTMG